MIKCMVKVLFISQMEIYMKEKFNLIFNKAKAVIHGKIMMSIKANFKIIKKKAKVL